MIESQLQRLILGRLHAIDDVFAWRTNTGAMRVGKRVVRFGMPGQSDILCIVNGRLLCIEVKSESGRQSAEQITFAARVRRSGGCYLLARDWESVAAAVEELRR